MAFLIKYLLLVLILYFFIRWIQRQLKLLSISNPAKKQSHNSRNHHNFPFTNLKNEDPYEILGISKNATAEEKKRAYHQALNRYHPDKVDHLGEDLKKVAYEKTAQIQWAYNQVKS